MICLACSRAIGASTGLAGSRDLVIPGHDHRVTKAYPAAATGLEGKVLRLDKPPAW
jgi:hypothetical protein